MIQNEQLCQVGGGGGGGATKVIHPTVAPGHVRSVCTADGNQGLQDSVHGQPSKNNKGPVHSGPSQPSKTTGPRTNAGESKRAIRDFPLSTDVPGFYSPIFLVAKESGGWHPILNLKAFNKFVKPPPFRMETLKTVMDCLGEAHQQRLKTSEHLRDSSMSETWAVSIYLRDAYHSRSHGTRTHEVPALCLRQQGVQVPSAPVWILDGTQGVHENSESDLSVPQDTGCQHALVSRRLALKKPVKVASRTPT